MKRLFSFALALLLSLTTVTFEYAAQVPAAGEYRIAATLTCHVDAMGGQEFGTGRIRDAVVKVLPDGSAALTLTFNRTYVDIYSIRCYTGIDATNSHPGYYDNDGVLHKDAAYTLSEDAIRMNLAPAGHMENDMVSDVRDVASMTFPAALYDEEILLYLYINSQIMGVQFCDGSGAYGSANPDRLTPYKAILRLDWAQMEAISLEEPQTGAPEEPQPTGAPEEPQTTDAPEEPQPTDVPEEPQTTGAPEEPQPTGTPEEPQPTDAPEEPQTTVSFLPYDGNQDGKVSAADARLALRAAVGLETLAENSPAFFAADCDGNGQITAGDARHILRAAVGLEPKAEKQTVIL